MKRSYIKRKNKRRFKGPKYEDPEYLDYIRSLPCTVYTFGNRPTDCSGRIDPHHYPSKACGGKDRGETTPLCRKHHTEFGVIGRWSWMLKYDMDLRKIGKELAEGLPDLTTEDRLRGDSE